MANKSAKKNRSFIAVIEEVLAEIDELESDNGVSSQIKNASKAHANERVGTIAYINFYKEFGYIKPEDGTVDIWFSYALLLKFDYPDAKIGSRVIYRIAENSTHIVGFDEVYDEKGHAIARSIPPIIDEIDSTSKYNKFVRMLKGSPLAIVAESIDDFLKMILVEPFLKDVPISTLIPLFTNHLLEKIDTKSGKDFDKKTPNKVNLYKGISDLLIPEGEDDELPDDDKERQLKRAFDALEKLPTGEISRIANTAEKRAESWPDDIPKIAPELYLDRPAREKLPKFLERVYGKAGYLNGIFTTAHLEIIDPPCAKAIRSWVSKHKSLPENILLPNKVDRPKGLKYNRN